MSSWRPTVTASSFGSPGRQGSKSGPPEPAPSSPAHSPVLGGESGSGDVGPRAVDRPIFSPRQESPAGTCTPILHLGSDRTRAPLTRPRPVQRGGRGPRGPPPGLSAAFSFFSPQRMSCFLFASVVELVSTTTKSNVSKRSQKKTMNNFERWITRLVRR